MAEPVALPVRVLLPQYARRRKTTTDIAAAAASPEAAAAAAIDRIADFGVR
jgi:predicted secreted Zn-dependent protease